MQSVQPRSVRNTLVSSFANRKVGEWIGDITDGIGVSDVLVSSAQVLALNASPIVAVAAPGAGKYLQFLGAAIMLDYNSAAYVAAAGEDLVFKYTDGAGAAVSNALDGTLFDGTADAVVFANPLNADASVLEGAVNAPIALHLLVGEWATGDSPLKIRTYFRTVTLSDLEAISTAAVAA